jgi:hypothetical protein
LLQQALLLASAGSITGIMPVMFGVFFMMLRGWRSAVHELSQVRHSNHVIYLTCVIADICYMLLMYRALGSGCPDVEQLVCCSS